MKLNDALENYYALTEKLSDTVRQLAFAGIAVVWLFRIADGDVGVVAPAYRLPALLLVVTLALDFLHYALASASWGIFHRKKEKVVDSEAEFLAPAAINYPANVCFWGKALALAVAYALLLGALATEAF